MRSICIQKTLSLAMLLAAVLVVGCTRIEPGYVGIKVNQYGSQKGVEDFPLLTGRVWFNPFTHSVYEFPTYMQNRSWTSTSEWGDEDESISFNSSEGATISADVGLNYTIQADKVPHIFVKHRQSVEVITQTYLRNKVRDALNRAGSQFKAVDIFGEKKQDLLDKAQNLLQEEVADDGFIIDTLTFLNAPQADVRVMDSINSVIEATQLAIEAENKVRQIEAEARQSVAKAKGESESVLMQAQAQAQANRLLTESITPALIQYKMLEQWDGVAPKVLGGGAEQLLLSVGND